MIRGLLWLPLLAMFCWLAWAGWNEYRKLEAYKVWAQQFDHAKYDIYAVLGQKDSSLTWGKPSRRGPIDLHTVSLQQVESIGLRLDDQLITDIANWDASSNKSKRVALEFQIKQAAPVLIPFTDAALAAKWGNHLQQDWQAWRHQATAPDPG
jgi:hypothetical protein